jgi:hypothetical protein
MTVTNQSRPRPKCRVTTIDPTVNDDFTRSYQQLSLWLNTTTGELYVCKDNTAGAAVWSEISAGGGGGAHVMTRDPAVTDDGVHGYDAGEFWVNTSNQTIFWCNSAATGAAVWDPASRKNTFSATAAPTTDNDTDEGWYPGSKWLDVSNLRYYVNVSNADGAAVWQDYVKRTGDTMTGNLAMGGNNITGVGSLTATTLTDGTWSTTAGAFTGVASIGTPSSITMAEDGWIGIGSGSERIVFDGTGGIIDVLSTRVGLGSGTGATSRYGSVDINQHFVLADSVGYYSDILHNMYYSSGWKSRRGGPGAYVRFQGGSTAGYTGKISFSVSSDVVGLAQNGALTLVTPMTLEPTLITSNVNAVWGGAKRIYFEASGATAGTESIYSAANGYLDFTMGTEARFTGGNVKIAGGNYGLVANNGYYLVTQVSSTLMQVGSGAGWSSGIQFNPGTGTPTVTMLTNGGVGIGTTTVPHGGIGYAKFALEGTDSNVAGPHIQITTSADDYPLIQERYWAHDNITWTFDGFYPVGGGAYHSSFAGSTFRINKVTNLFKFEAGSAAVNTDVTFATAFQIEADADVMMSPAAAHKTYWRDTGLSISSQSDGRLDIDADGNIDFNIGGSERANISTSGVTFTVGAAGTWGLYVVENETYTWSLMTSFFYDQLVWQMQANHGNQLIIGQEAGGTDYGHTTTTHPTLFIHSTTSLASDATQYVGIWHDTTGAQYYSGKSLHTFNGTVTATTLTDGTASLTGGALTGLGSIATPTSITMAEAGTVGLAAEYLRFVHGTEQITSAASLVMANAKRTYYEASGSTKGTESIYSAADGYLDVGAETAIRLNSLSVGINVAAPSAKLHVDLGSNQGTIAFFEGGDGANWENYIQVGAFKDSAANATVLGHHFKSGANTDWGFLKLYGAPDTIMFDYAGNVGIGTTTVPHGGVGAAKLAIHGANASTSGPHVQFTTASDDYPLIGLYPWAQDSVLFGVDAYFDGTNWRSSQAVSNYGFTKNASKWAFWADGGIAAGSVVTPVTAFQIEADADVMFSPNAALKTYWRDAGIWAYSPSDSILELSADGYVRVGAGTTSHAISGAGAFLVSTDLEVNATTYLDGNTYVYSNILLSGNLGVAGTLRGADAGNGIIASVTVAAGRQWTLTDYANKSKNHDHAACTTPTFFWQSDLDPDVSNNEWGSATHDGTGLLFSTGVNTGTGSAPTTIDNDIRFAPRGTLSARFTGDNQAFFGDGAWTNYASFAADGELTLHGTARVTRIDLLANANLGKGTTGMEQIIVGNYTAWEADIDDDAVISTAIPKDWAPGTDIVVEVCWFVDEAYATASAEVRWQVDWSATPNDGSEAIDAPTHSGSGDTGDVNVPATANGVTESEAVTIPGASLAVGDEIGLTLSRIDLADGTDPTAKPSVVHLYLKYTSDRLGEAT